MRAGLSVPSTCSRTGSWMCVLMKPHSSDDKGNERQISGKHTGVVKFSPGLTQLSGNPVGYCTDYWAQSEHGRGWAEPKKKELWHSFTSSRNWIKCGKFYGGKIARNSQNSFPRYWLKTYKFKHSEVKYRNLTTPFSQPLTGSFCWVLLQFWSFPLFFLCPKPTAHPHLPFESPPMNNKCHQHLPYFVPFVFFSRMGRSLSIYAFPSKTNDLQHSYFWLGLKM